MTLAETGQIMDILGTAYPRFYSGDKGRKALSLWAAMFEPYPAEIVAAAVKAHIAADTKGFPPVIGQVMEQVRKITQPEELSETEAWALVRKALTRSGYNSREEYDKLPEAVRRAVGSPEQLKVWAIDDNFNDAVRSSNFMRAYRTMEKRREEYEAMPADVQRLSDALGGKLALESGGESDDG